LISVPGYQNARNRERLVKEHQAKYRLDAAIGSGSHPDANSIEATWFHHA